MERKFISLLSIILFINQNPKVSLDKPPRQAVGCLWFMIPRVSQLWRHTVLLRQAVGCLWFMIPTVSQLCRHTVLFARYSKHNTNLHLSSFFISVVSLILQDAASNPLYFSIYSWALVPMEDLCPNNYWLLSQWRTCASIITGYCPNALLLP